MTSPLRLAALALLTLLSGCASSEAATPRRRPSIEPRVLERLRPAHPRLLVLDEDVARVRDLLDRDPALADWHAQVRARGLRILDEAPAAHDPARPIENARRVMARVTECAGLYRLTGDARFADRARQEILAAAAFPDWGEAISFLAVAEMTAGVAIGYDWLHGAMPPDERDAVADAILTKGLAPAERQYAAEAFWTVARHNWNAVCNGGVTLGALAVADREPERAARLVALARDSVTRSFEAFGPDGGWEEGPGYANYTTRYATFLVAALETACGDDFGLRDVRGFADAGRFRAHTTGPTGKRFNFADGGDAPGTAPYMFWLARAFDRPAYAAFEHRLRAVTGDAPGIFDVLWYEPPPPDGMSGIPLDAAFRHPTVGVAALRSSWDDADATFVAFKGGSNEAHHGHLDLGTFVLDALGQRWAVDLGPDRYDLPGYTQAWKDRRWTYYRTGTIGQNTLLVEGTNQDREAVAKLVAFGSDADRAYAVVDLTDAYPKHACRARRGVALLGRRDVLVQDEVDPHEHRRGRRAAGWVWQMHTRADVHVSDDGTRARLSQGGRTIEARLLSPAGAAFAVETPDVNPPQTPLDGVVKLVVRVRKSSMPFRVAVLFTPAPDEADDPPLRPLETWIAESTRDARPRRR